MKIFRVPDMICGGCVQAITKAVRADDPAAEITADIATHLVTIDSVKSPSILRAAIEAAGFTPELAASPA
ncbi:MAG: copper chaperone [Acetobacteraceae bacterium]|nr:copper chaperone [Acetobacteraceae bacterium]MSP29086.1 copper chaperone [Acetobacteraceae bacterium]